MIRKLLLTFSVLLLPAATAAPAYASSALRSSPHLANGPQAASQEICAQAGGGYCLNDWNGAGSGGAVKMYNSGYTNDNWQENRLGGYCAGGYVDETTACPFPNGSGQNTAFNDDPIVEIKSSVSGACIGTDIYANVNLGACPPSSGGAGSNIWVIVSQAPGIYYLVNVYWSDRHGNSSAAYLLSGGSIGAQAIVTTASGSQWGVP